MQMSIGTSGLSHSVGWRGSLQVQYKQFFSRYIFIIFFKIRHTVSRILSTIYRAKRLRRNGVVGEERALSR